jgi:phosphopantothenoylcysteine synthetase/decarboxylase
MRFLITSGGTREYIDPVRFISNASSGMMGCALARAALAAGHRVTVITAPTSIKPPQKAHVVNVVSAKDMYEAVRREFASCDCLIMAAAVSDYTPTRKSATKIKKGAPTLTLQLKRTVDILPWASSRKKHRIVVGFALEDKHLRRRAEMKLTDKNLDMIIANSPSAIGAAESSVLVKTPDHDWIALENTGKTAIARRIIRIVEQLGQAK